MGKTRFKSTIEAQNSLQVGESGSALSLIKRGTVTVDLPSIAPGVGGTADATVTGAQVNDIVVLCPRSLTAGLVVGQAFVSAADTITIRAVNGTGGSIDEASATWDYLLIRS